MSLPSHPDFSACTAENAARCELGSQGGVGEKRWPPLPGWEWLPPTPAIVWVLYEQLSEDIEVLLFHWYSWQDKLFVMDGADDMPR